jgi:hypothetical protein
MTIKLYEQKQTTVTDLLQELLKGRRVRLLSWVPSMKSPIFEGVVERVDVDGIQGEGEWLTFTFEGGITHPVSLYQDFEIVPKTPSRQRAYQMRQNAKGLCSMCNEPRVTAKLCEKHRVKRNERQKAQWKGGTAYYIQRIAKGMCVQCTQPRVTARLCEDHRMRHNERQRAKRKAKND